MITLLVWSGNYTGTMLSRDTRLSSRDGPKTFHFAILVRPQVPYWTLKASYGNGVVARHIGGTSVMLQQAQS